MEKINFKKSLNKMLERKTLSTFSTMGPLDPSKDPTAFTQSYTIKRETKSASKDSEEVDVIPLTKVEIVPSDTTANPKHIYINISAQNTLTGVGIPAQFQIDFDQPFLRNAEKYYLTIAKATFPTTSIPLLTFKEDTYIVSIDYKGVFYNANLVPINIVSSAGVYYVSYYQQFIDSLNNALLSAFTNLIATDATFGGTLPPYFTYDKPTNRFSIIVEDGYWYSGPGATGASLALDYNTYRLFNSIPSIPYVSASIGNSVSLLIENSGLPGSNSKISNAVNYILGSKLTNTISDFSLFSRYNRGMTVTYNGFTYSAIQSSLGQIPSISPLIWQVQLASASFDGIWSAAVTYTIGQVVYYPTQNSVPVVSIQYPNLNNIPNPAAATAFWRPLKSGVPTTWRSTGTYVVNQNVWYPNIGSGNIYIALTGTAGTNPSTDVTNWASSMTFNADNIIGEYSTLSQWSDIEAIVIQTGTLPIRYEIYTPPQTDVTSNTSSTSGSQVPRPVLTDLDLFKNADGFDRTPVQYVPNGPYRMIDMLAREELKRIDSFIQYKHKDLSFTDLIMLPGDYFAIKYLFIRNDALCVT